jgi:hypothetical protein
MGDQLASVSLDRTLQEATHAVSDAVDSPCSRHAAPDEAILILASSK